MQVQCNAEQLQFAGMERRGVMATIDGEAGSSDAGALLPG